MRNEELESIFEALYEWQNAEPKDAQARRDEYARLILELATRLDPKSKVLPYEIEGALLFRYREFCRAKRLEEKLKGSRLR